ncbi:hypothetical protein M0R45_011423 [Rubus argutus]|uniref:Uncharacterized protein n=1 Tax=Rubus argutus TaxID=59490 RepID=A0AAW1YAW2_RUBAR
MVVEVLSPHDCLKDPSRQGLLSHPMKYHQRNPNPTPNRPSRPQPDRRKQLRKPTRPNSSSPPARSPVQKTPVPQNLVIGQVKILKRGEELPKPAPFQPPSKENRSPQKQNQKVPDLGSTDRFGSEPGEASPPPSSVPLPSFFSKNRVVVSNTDEAASELLKLLRLNLS